jgi:hypothetical protein
VHPQEHGSGAWVRLGKLVDRKATGGMHDGGADAAHAGEAIRRLAAAASPAARLA